MRSMNGDAAETGQLLVISKSSRFDQIKVSATLLIVLKFFLVCYVHICEYKFRQRAEGSFKYYVYRNAKVRMFFEDPKCF